MIENSSALYSEYIIDGVPMELTPASVLDSCLAPGHESSRVPEQGREPVVDETVDPCLSAVVTDPSRLVSYMRKVRETGHHVFPKPFAESFTRASIAKSLVEAIWSEGHFRLGDLGVRLDWKWPSSHIGDMAAFYASVTAAADYIDSLGLRISDYSFAGTEEDAELHVSTGLLAVQPRDDDEERREDFFAELPFRTEYPQIKAGKAHPSRLVPDAQSWLIYVPFDDCDYRLGGSLLAQALGASGAIAPQVEDPDYFIDCYEVVRELVEDHIILSGVTVGDGGLMSAIKRMTGSRVGADIELADLVRATGEKDIVRLLFSEVPGALFQISDIDYDYVDAELLLQDVAFFPLGHPSPDRPGIRVQSSEKSGIQVILESIIRSQNSEGED